MQGGRTPLVAGNWKMNTDLSTAVALATELAELTISVDNRNVEIAVCPPFPFLRDVKMVIRPSSSNSILIQMKWVYLIKITCSIIGDGG